MEYLQCPQCGKKYGVNDQVRAAAGKTTKCRQCGHIFPIVIHTKAERKGTAAHDHGTHGKASAIPQGKGTKSGQPGFQLYAAIAGVILLTTGLVVSWYLEKPPATETGQAEQTEPATAGHPTRSAQVGASGKQERAPASGSVDGTTAAGPAPSTNEHQELTLAEALLAPGKPYRSTFSGSDECLDLAAAHWNLVYEMTHSRLTNHQMSQMIERNSESTKSVTGSCKDSSIAAEINDAARMGEIPLWLQSRVKRPDQPRQQEPTGNEPDAQLSQ